MDHHDDLHSTYAEDYPLRPLEDDCQLLGDLLDSTLKIEIGEELFQKARRSAAQSCTCMQPQIEPCMPCMHGPQSLAAPGAITSLQLDYASK